MHKIVIPLLIIALLFVGCTSNLPSRQSTKLEVSDISLLYTTPPLWYQLDPHYASIPYGDDTIGESGCGLCSAATAISFIEQKRITPKKLADMYGSSCVVYGVNDMALFCKHLHEDFGTSNSEQLWDINQALDHLKQGHLVFASVDGMLDSMEYSGHIVVLWKDAGDDYYVIDSMQLRPLRVIEHILTSYDFVYFYAIWKE